MLMGFWSEISRIYVFGVDYFKAKICVLYNIMKLCFTWGDLLSLTLQLVSWFVLQHINTLLVISRRIKFQTIQFSISTQFTSIWPIVRTLSGATILGQSGPGSNANEEVPHIPQSSSITGTSPSDCLVSWPGHFLGEFKPLWRDGVGVFYSPSRMGNTFQGKNHQLDMMWKNFHNNHLNQQDKEKNLPSWKFCHPTRPLSKTKYRKMYTNIWNLLKKQDK